MTLPGFRSRCSTPFSCAAARPAQSLRAISTAFIGGQPADAAQQASQIFAIHVFHRKEHLAVDFAEIVNAADVGMRNLARDADFVAEARQSGFIAGHACGQKFERDRLLQRQVVGAVDLAHSAFAEQRDDAIALREQSPGRKPAFRVR